jgi:LacI family transcriptional regulator
MTRASTIGDIARRIGVSKSTVSRGLAGSSRISADTRRRILSAAKSLHYEPNYLARGLSKSRTLAVGVILEDIMNPFFTEVAKGIQTALADRGYTMLLTSSGYVPATELELARTLLRYKVDGVLITPVSADSEAIRFLRSHRVPFFMMNEKTPDRDVNWIDSDNLAGGALAAEHLLGLGHRRFLILRNGSLHGTADRFEGLRAALEGGGLSLSDQVVLDGAVSSQDGAGLVAGFLEDGGRRDMPSAVVGCNDAVAIGAMESLFSHGIRVPGDVSVIGYDDIYMDAFIRVPLTTVHQAKFRMGQIAARGLLAVLDGTEAAGGRQFLIKPKLVIRESCREYSR